MSLNIYAHCGWTKNSKFFISITSVEKLFFGVKTRKNNSWINQIMPRGASKTIDFQKYDISFPILSFFYSNLFAAKNLNERIYAFSVCTGKKDILIVNFKCRT